ncbi:MAG: O-antigen ligase family protein [Kofleriaceae bacterium]|nr:O-antigen ligase family protein [Kofleriaceae bacterium]
MAIAVAATLWSKRAPARRSPLILFISVAIGLSLLQLLPLPAALIAWLNPTGTALRDEGAALLGTTPWNAISLDAHGTLGALCSFTMVLGIAVVATRVAASERGRRRIVGGIAAACGLTAVIVGVHELVGASSLYGIYEPAQARPSIVGPLLNENHLGCLMAVGTSLALGLALHGQQASRARAAWLGVAASCGVVAIASESRGAALALGGGVFVTLGAIVGQRFLRDDSPRMRATFATTSLPIGIVVIAAMLVVFYASAGGLSHDLARTSLDEIEQPRSKMAIWRASVALVEEAPWMGVGRGGFEAAITRHHPAAALNSFSHVENEYLQAIIDWGVLGAAAIAFAALWLAWRSFRRWRDGTLTAGALGAIAVVAIQSSVDFGIELLGIAAPVTAIVATTAHVPLRELSGRALALARAKRIALIFALGGAAILLTTPLTATLAEDHALLSSRAPLELGDVTAHAEAHPLDYYAFARGAERAGLGREAQAVRLLNHALRLHPTHPALHQAAARLLLRRGLEEQAAIEYALALRSTPSVDTVLGEIVSRLGPDAAARAIPIDMPLAMITKRLRDLDRPRVSILWLERLLEARPENLEACEWLYSTASRAQDLDAALTASTRCRRAAPTFAARIGLARTLLAKEHPLEAAQVLADVENWPGRIDTKVTGWLLLCDTFLAERRWDETRRCLHRLDATSNIPAAQRNEVRRRFERVDELSRAAPSATPL